MFQAKDPTGKLPGCGPYKPTAKVSLLKDTSVQLPDLPNVVNTVCIGSHLGILTSFGREMLVWCEPFQPKHTFPLFLEVWHQRESEFSDICYSFVPALKRLLLGTFFMIIYTVASPYIDEEYLVSDDYMVSSAEGFYNLILRRIK